jgi:phage tail sheath protein FI
MPDYKAPGIYIEDRGQGPRPIEGVSTTVVAFLGFAERGPLTPIQINSLTEFTENFGGSAQIGNLTHAIRAFFANGGTRCFVLRVPTECASPAEVLALLDGLDEVSMVCCPDEYSIPGMAGALVVHCERMRYRIAVLGAPPDSNFSDLRPDDLKSAFGAYYAPWITVTDPASGAELPVHPGGHVAGAIVRNDLERGVWKAPANLALLGAVGLTQQITDAQQAVLNQRGINALRYFPGKGYLIWGARTTSQDPEWKYVNVRRYLIYLEKSIDQGTQWVVFENNGPALWSSVQQTISDFLFNEWDAGALQGTKPDDAYFVRCDRTTMTQDDIDNGRLVCLVGVAVLKPAEFVIFRIGQWTANANCS